MEKAPHLPSLLARSRHLPLLVVALTLLVLAATLMLTTRAVRVRIREQIAGRDGEVLYAVALMLQEKDVSAASLEDPANQLSLVLAVSRLKDFGVLGMRLIDSEGRFVFPFPPNVRPADLEATDVATLRKLRPVSRFHQGIQPVTLFYPELSESVADQRMPLLEVNVPLHARGDSRLLGIVQFLIEGQSIAGEYARLDRHLFLQAAGHFGAAGTTLVIGIAWAFARLRRTNRLLAERTTDLLQANQELALAAKTSAVGTITAHLIHGLKSPLSGLETFVSNLSLADGEGSEEYRRQAAASTRRMQELINQVVNVLRDEEGDHQYQLELDELARIVEDRVRVAANKTGVRFVSQTQGASTLPSRTSNLTVLILVNLVQNALQATPAGKTVTLALAGSEDRIVCEVRDEGAGVSEEIKKQLFSPCRSTKEGGCGIGLAISKQLANHLGASLELRENSSTGCVFRLTLPSTGANENSGRAQSAPTGYTAPR